MKRRHLFEFSDQSWLPPTFRKYLTDILEAQAQAIYRHAMPKLATALRRSRATHILDLCSGSGGPWKMIDQFLKKTVSDPPSITLSDKYPEQYRSLFSDSPSIDYYPKFLDAREVPAGQKGFRTLFTAFHHFRPEDAQQILQDAVDKQCPIAIFEFTERTRERLKGMWKSPRLAYQITPKLRPKSRGRIFWTFVLPVIPMIYLWDGWVSQWRTYTVEELEGMALATGAENYRWDIGQIEVKGTPNKITYLIGIPGP